MLASTVDALISSSQSSDKQDDKTKNAALEVTQVLFNEGLNRLAGSMHSGSKDEAVKRYEGDNFKMEVQKKTCKEFKDEGSNHIVMET